MRSIFIVIVAAVAIIGVAKFSATVMTAEAPQARRGAGPIVIDIMQMMRQARDLPVQQFDAI